MLDGAFLQVIEHLIAGRCAGKRGNIIEVRYIEVADAPGEDLAGLQ